MGLSDASGADIYDAATGEKINERRLFAHVLYSENDLFAKTGSGQTSEKLKRECRFLAVRCTNGALIRSAKPTTISYRLSEEFFSISFVSLPIAKLCARHNHAFPMNPQK